MLKITRGKATHIVVSYRTRYFRILRLSEFKKIGR
jgi:hypothetical protein